MGMEKIRKSLCYQPVSRWIEVAQTTSKGMSLRLYIRDLVSEFDEHCAIEKVSDTAQALTKALAVFRCFVR